MFITYNKYVMIYFYIITRLLWLAHFCTSPRGKCDVGYKRLRAF